MQTTLSKKISTAAAVFVGLLMLAATALYWMEPAGQLPSFLPGYAAGSLEHHTKHGIMALALAICCFIAARFFWGPSSDSAA